MLSRDGITVKIGHCTCIAELVASCLYMKICINCVIHVVGWVKYVAM